MRIVEKILCGIGVLIAMLFLLIGACKLIPNLSKTIGESIPEKKPTQTVNTTTDPTRATENTSQEVVELKPATTDNKLEGLADTLQNSGYVSPDETTFDIDEMLKELNGLLEIEATGEYIPSQKEKELEKDLTVGETGDGLTFDPLKYPYYNMLDKTNKQIYRQLYANMMALTKKVKPITKIDRNRLSTTFSAVMMDQPQLFWVQTGYGYLCGMDGTVSEIDFMYYGISDHLDSAKKEFASAAGKILEGAQKQNSDYEKEVYVHDALMKQIVYSKAAPMNQSAYSALVSGKTVCAGYARAFQFLMMSMDVPCYFCAGHAPGNHAWNIIKLEDDFYNVDVTWDDSDPNNHNYFNCSDAVFSKDHARRELSIYLPPCNGEKYSDLIADVPKDYKEPTAEDKIYDVRKSLEDTVKEAEQKEKDAILEKEKNSETEEESTTETDTDSNTKTEETKEPERIDEKKVCKNLAEYYALCKQILSDDAGKSKKLEFKISVENKQLWQDVLWAYNNGDYLKGYANDVLWKYNIEQMTVTVDAKRKSGGNYEITHTVTQVPQ